MTFIKDLIHDEIRDGWLVTTDMKKVWHRQLEIWQEFDRICRKHKITYWAAYGTLLGAARHKGFIPWDDDIDFYMFRPDYNRFYEVVEDELMNGVFEIYHKYFSMIKISHSQTTLLSHENLRNSKFSGLILDVFPLDITLDGSQSAFFAVNAINELLGTIYNYPAIVEHVQNGGKTVNNWSVIETLHNFSDQNKTFEFMNIYAEGLFEYSSKVDWIEQFVLKKKLMPQSKSCFRETVYLPFEKIKLPAPIDYDEVLTSCYDDWHQIVVDRRGKLGFVHSADIPYREFLKLIDLDLIMPSKNK